MKISKITRREFIKASAGLLGSTVLLPGMSQVASAASQTYQSAVPINLQASSTLRIALGVDPDTMDPTGQTNTTTQNMVDYLAETLVELQDDGTYAPGLAEKWETSADGKSWTFYIRKGVKFHDGDTLNANAVKLSLQRYLNPDMKVPLRSPLGDVIDTVDTVDDYTVRFNLKFPAPWVAAALTGTATSIVSPAHAKGFPTKNNEQPVGTGPYKFQDRRPGESVTFVRNEDYWGKKPYYQTVQFRIVPEATTRETLLLSGQADIVILPPAADFLKLSQNPQVKFLLAPSNRTIFIALDCARPVFKDKRVRQALNYAVDKEGILKYVLFGAGRPSTAPIAPEFFGYTKCGYYEYNPDKAKQLLKEAGVTDLSFKMIYPTGRYLQDAQAAQAVIANWMDIGIKVDAATMDWPTYTATFQVPIDKATTDAHFLGLASYFLDSVHSTLPFKTVQMPPAGLNTAHYSNPALDDLIEGASKELDQTKRAKMYGDALKMYWDDAPWVFLWEQRFPIAYSAKIKGVGATPIEKFSCLYAEPA